MDTLVVSVNSQLHKNHLLLSNVTATNDVETRNVLGELLLPILNRYKEHEMAKERMTAIKNIRYLFESDEVENDKVMFCGLKGRVRMATVVFSELSLQPTRQHCSKKSMKNCSL